MSKAYPTIQPLALDAYSKLADRYDKLAPTKPHNGLYERPASLALLNAQPHEQILDAGCGPGIASEHIAKAGATVQGLDVTPRMIELARERCKDLDATFRVADMAKPLEWLADESFDKVLSSLMLDYVAELGPVFAEFARVTKPGGSLVFSMGHPMADWMHKDIRGSGSYFDRSRFGMYWEGFGEPKPYVESYRRSLSEIINSLVDANWQLAKFHEPRPTPQMKEADPQCYQNLSKYPVFMCIHAIRGQ